MPGLWSLRQPVRGDGPPWEGGLPLVRPLSAAEAAPWGEGRAEEAFRSPYSQPWGNKSISLKEDDTLTQFGAD